MVIVNVNSFEGDVNVIVLVEVIMIIFDEDGGEGEGVEEITLVDKLLLVERSCGMRKL